MLFNEAIEANIKLSIATAYNTLNQFAKAGLLRRVMPNRSRLFFDTDTSIHPHFYLVGEGILTNIPGKLLFAQMPKALPATGFLGSTSSFTSVGQSTCDASQVLHWCVYDQPSYCLEALSFQEAASPVRVAQPLLTIERGRRKPPWPLE
ncbi:hypothetical protein AOQ71_04240 [Bradyrhizobium manausense]|uniref:Ferric uptake regulation protein n=2 Tax=Bradyrhizobium manausense TaxID=989370 RepID=A0A0R3E4K5_9BRAD|nr:hypothetical protein AOQ71_04240 [Bradyrhizobium manausense]